MERAAFLRRLKAASHELSDFLAPRSKQWLNDVITEKESGAFDDDRIYEILCFFRLPRIFPSGTTLSASWAAEGTGNGFHMHQRFEEDIHVLPFERG